MSSVLIIGGGAAGMAAAIAAAACGDRVTVLERMDRVGKKILATGNGRCNLMNTGALRYPGGAELAQKVLAVCGAAEQRRFWEHLGLRMREEGGGRVYPVSGMASTVLDTLRLTMSAMGVEVLTGVHADGLSHGKKGWTVMAGEARYRADRVIIAGGGCAQPKLGSDGSCYALLKGLGHPMVRTRPALTQIMTDTRLIRGLSGVRVRCSLRVAGPDGGTKYAEQGELLFADYGVTGVCVMQCARYAGPGDALHVDMTGALGFDDAASLRQELLRRRREWAARPAGEWLTGLCVPKLAGALLRAAGVSLREGESIAAIPAARVDALIAAIADLTLTVEGVKGFDNAQVTAGGVAADGFDPLTLASRFAPGIHAAGEVLDVDGDCGGYNLMFAFGSGILAGLNGRKAPWL